MGRFEKYASNGDLAELFKPEPGESRTGTLKGVREWTSEDGDEYPVLDLVDSDGNEFAYRASPWRALVCLEQLDPSDGSVLKISRGQDIGKSHNIQIEFAGVDAQEPPY